MKIGFIGLGTMGMGMARNLLKKNGSLTVYTAKEEKCVQLAEEGFDIACSHAELADCGIIFLCLPVSVIENDDGIANTSQRI